ncbi:hypothetical protein BU25DRAFT_435478 [Macroventuria anomochaeta]|uniref:Uncharacterized protein n=1 Tax=Macroventuria anomochaeta TaxID=301207 RepID=A0ACB6RI28_9PLEO|nr:uncharacterized protein BU25DRAFT_435478 [Macroventuria anomochaeta]KAF2621551.1 hypothetical protein BU25DRAFT_435478 [Macroventuria anomochaeta]
MTLPSDEPARDNIDSPDVHRHVHGAVASHFLAQPRDAYGGETWADFLREAGVDPARRRPQPTHTSTAASMDSPSSSSPSSDRKRRLTAAESPVRRPSSTRMRSSSHAGSSADPIVLGSSPAPLRERPLPPPPPPPPSYSALSNTPRPFRRESDLVLPPWQPDSHVTHCPVCNRQFTFLFRKHHCRKCGRVVCSQCSPHRITIPRQFIVHPPSDGSNGIIDLTGDDDMNPMSNFGPFRNPALGGGEEVRVCNPCVPDPNYSLPPQYPSSASHAPGQPPQPPARPEYSPGAVPPYQRAHRSSSSVHVAPHAAGQGQTQSSRGSFSNRRVSYHDASRSEDRWPSPLPTLGHVYPSHARQHEQSPSSSRPPTGPSYLPQAHQQRAGSGSSSVRGDMVPRQFFVPSQQPPPIQQLNPRPRRQIAEEDECPICGGELPAKGPDGDDSARSQHIEECIALHSSSPAPNSTTRTTRPQAQTSASLPVTRTRGMSSAGNGEGASSSHRHSHAARGMFPYIATEKDCVDEDGNDAECVICFEEFEAGDKMARLVCWCKFHEKCIKDWWKMKGRGACPTHQLHEE